MVVSRGTPQQPRAKERVDLVIKASQEVLAEKGYTGLTLSAVCQRANIKQTSIYRYWPNQSALLATLVSHFEQEYQQQIIQLEEIAFDNNWKDIQKMLLQGLADYCCEHPWVFAGLAGVRADKGIAQRHEQTLNFFASRYGHLLKIGGLGVRGEEEARVSRTYVLLLDSFMFAIGRANDSPRQIADVIEDYYEVVLSYLSPRMKSDADGDEPVIQAAD
jgi:AcrR family transcriptional regulator